MKKFLSSVAALGLVAGVASTASAVDVKLKGYYEVDGFYFDHGDGQGVALTKTTPESTSDAAIAHTFHIQPILKINDKVKMVSDIYLADDTLFGQDDTTTTDGQNFEVHKLFMEYMSPIGKIRVGRHLANPFGTSFLDTELHQDRIMWWPKFLATMSIKTLLFTAKVKEFDGTSAQNDSDHDYYEARIYHTATAGKFIAGFGWNNIRSNITNPAGVLISDKYDKYRFKASGSYNFGSVYLQAEYHYDFGTRENINPANPDVDLETHAFMADVGVKSGQLDVGAMFIFATGDDNGTADNEMSAAMTSGQGNNGLGKDFTPYYILTGRWTGIFNPTLYGLDTDAATAGILSIGAHTDYQVNAQLNWHAAVGYALAESEQTSWDDDYGLEIDLGMGYKLLDNLTYALHLGYLMTGDFFKRGVPTNDVEDILYASHHLTMEF